MLPTVLLRIFVFAVVVFLHDTRFLRNTRQSTRPKLVAAASVVFGFHSWYGPRTGRSYGTVASVVNSAVRPPRNRSETTNTAGPDNLCVPVPMKLLHRADVIDRRPRGPCGGSMAPGPRSRNLYSLLLVFVASWTTTTTTTSSSRRILINSRRVITT